MEYSRFFQLFNDGSKAEDYVKWKPFEREISLLLNKVYEFPVLLEVARFSTDPRIRMPPGQVLLGGLVTIPAQLV